MVEEKMGLDRSFDLLYPEPGGGLPQSDLRGQLWLEQSPTQSIGSQTRLSGYHSVEHAGHT